MYKRISQLKKCVNQCPEGICLLTLNAGYILSYFFEFLKYQTFVIIICFYRYDMKILFVLLQPLSL